MKQLQVRDKDADDEAAMRIVPMMREYTVFNVDQCDGLPDRVLTLGEVKRRNPDERDATIDEFLAASGATIREGFGEAYPCCSHKQRQRSHCGGWSVRARPRN